MENTVYQSASRRFYKPSTTRAPVLIFLLFLTLFLIAITELACRHIPAHAGVGKLGNVVDDVLSKPKNGTSLLRRLNSSMPISPVSIAPTSTVNYLTPIGPVSQPISVPQGQPTETAIGGYLSPNGSPLTPASVSQGQPTSTAIGGYLNPSGSVSQPTSVQSSSMMVIVGYLQPSGYSSSGISISQTPVSATPLTPVSISETGTATGGDLSVGNTGTPLVPSATGPYLSVGNNPLPPSSIITLTTVAPISVPQTPSTSATGLQSVVTLATPIAGYLSTSVVPVSISGVSAVSITPSTETQVSTPIVSSGQTLTTPAPTLVFVDGHVSTQTTPGIATDANGSPLPILTSVDGQVFAVTPVMTVVNGKTIAETPVLTVIGGQTLAVTPVVAVMNGQTFTATPVLTVVGGQTYAETPYITVSSGVTYTTTPIPIEVISTGVPPSGYLSNGGSATSTAIYPTATIVNSTGTYFAWSNDMTTLAPQITLDQYVTVSFVPLIIAVLYTIPWRILDSTFREMEPFYQLNQHGGALGRNSLCLDYSTSFLITVPFKALYRGHFIPFWSSLISLSVLVLAPLSSEAFFVSLSGDCGPNSTGDCNASWGIYSALARFIQGVLSFVAVLLILILIFNARRGSGVYSEPLSIIGLTILLSKSPLLQGLRQIDSLISTKELKDMLAKKHFALSSFLASDGSRCHGIVPLDTGDSELGFFAATIKAGKKGRYSAVTQATDETGINTTSPESTHRQFGKRQDIKQKGFYFFSFFILGGLLCLITYYHYTGPNPVTGKSTGFEEFMDSQGFGVRFMMTALGVAVKLLWSNIDTGKPPKITSFKMHQTNTQQTSDEISLLHPSCAAQQRQSTQF
ncbi:hypothetical protein G7Y89_g4876 [Cudoniella acicularis]|uniref:Uncharacterized protein n=1 Tax=Cudoniella acicularis TaxID=354080 RepID=A0A8H4RPW6_9HELO|nr:hypothetical protein G7Y89_g4876 [Cudoniella acicularis]